MTGRTRRMLLGALLALGTAACGGGSGSGGGGDAPDGAGDAADAAGDASGDDADDAGPTPAERLRAVPETARFELPGLSAPVHVVRTELDRPHVYAETLHDLYVGQGFVMARDRFFEMELGSRLARGRLAELVGDLVLEADLGSRLQGMAYVAQRIEEHLDPQVAAAFDAFAEGANAWIAAVQAGELPPPSELAVLGPLLGVDDPTTLLAPVDRGTVAGFAALVVYNSSIDDNDVRRDDVARRVVGHFGDVPLADLRNAGLVEDIWRSDAPVWDVSSSDPAHALATVTGALSARAAAAPPAAAPPAAALPVPASLLARFLPARARLQARVGRPVDREHGSNAWAVSGRVSGDGATLLAGDGHLPLGIPPIFYQMGLDTTVLGGGDLHQTGLFLPGAPLFGVGTNGHLAYSQTYPRADVTDWYAEQIALDADGAPATSVYRGEARPLVRVDEVYTVAGSPLGPARTETWPRWTTFDGRFVQEIEGRPVEADEALAPGETRVAVTSGFVVPGDTDGDGVITALSMDYTGFDIGDMGGFVQRLAEAKDVAAFQQATRYFVGYAQNLVAADAEGGVQFTSFTATPCRGYLPRGEDGGWAPGAHPNRLLDGTQHPGFTVELGADGLPLHEGDLGAGERCVIPFDAWPDTLDPARGWVMNANNDPGSESFDGRLDDAPWHLGGPWDPGFRGRTISEDLAAAVAAGEADADRMRALQANHRSPVGALFAPHLLEAVAAGADAALAAAPEGAEARLAAIYEADAAAFAEAAARVQGWLDRGAVAASGVETFYASPSATDREDAVATMIFNAWFRAWLAAVLDDEDIRFALGAGGWASTVVPRTLWWMVDGRGPGNPRGLASWNPETEESAFFDVLDTPEVETSREVALAALRDALAGLRAPAAAPDRGGFGTDDMAAWLWGLRHQVRFESILVGFAGDNPLIDVIAGDFAIDTARLPLAPSLPPGDPRAGLRWFPRPGDLFNVDAGTPAFRGPDYHYADGPVMRMVIALKGGRATGWNIIPGGQSGLTDSPHFADQAALWLGNEALPLRHELDDVLAGAAGREVLAPPAP